ncbi:hypothetical protein GCM10027074_07410 [Streptomyces deserti]
MAVVVRKASSPQGRIRTPHSAPGTIMPKNTPRRFPLATGAACLAAALALPTGVASAVTAPQDLAPGAAAPAQPTPTPPDPETTVPEDTPTDETTAPEDTPTDETTAPEDTPTDETTAPEDTPTDETTAPEDTPTDEDTTPEDTPTDEDTTPEDTPTETGEATPLPTPTTPEEAQEEVAKLREDPDTPDEVKGDLNELATVMNEAQNKPAPVREAAVDISVSVIVAVDAMKSPRTSPADKAALSDCVKELTASVKVIVDVRVSVTVRQALVQVSVTVRVTVRALQRPDVPPKTKTAVRGAVREQTAALKVIRSPGTSQAKKKQLANVTKPIEIVSRIVINVRTSTSVKNQAQQVLVQLTAVVKTVRETDKQPSAKWRACDKALRDLNASTATTIPQPCEGNLRS